MEIPILKDLITIFGLSIVVLLICHRLRVPTIVGFLITGILCGPSGLGLVDAIADVNTLAEIGIVLLLFTVGMEFSFKKILEHKRFFIVGGVLQVTLTTLTGFVVAKFLDRPTGEAVFFGFLISLSSTAIVLRIIQERLETNTPHGRMILGILIFQDIIVVLMMLITPILAGKETNFDLQFLIVIGEGILVLAGVLIAAEVLVPRLLHLIARTGTRELFLLTVVVICFSVAYLASTIGLSLALGAFLAGLIIAESEYSNEAIGDIISFLDIFTSFFFVSVGMLLDIHFVIQHPILVFTVALAIMLLKGSIITLVGIIMGMPFRTAFIAGLALCQVGEFSFVLVKSGMKVDLGSDFNYQLFLSVSVLSMAATPMLIVYAAQISNYILKLPMPESIRSGLKPVTIDDSTVHDDHVLIIGYGNVGKHLVKATKEAGVPYAILDMDPEHVREERRKGEPIHFGDATHGNVLKHVNVTSARVIAVLINDPIAVFRIVDICRKLNPHAHIIVRSRYVEETQPLYKLGANDVVTDELGASIEVFMRVLRYYKTPTEKINQLVDDMRREGYDLLRLYYTQPATESRLDLGLEDLHVGTYRVDPSSVFVNKTLAESELLSKYGLNVILVRRGTETILDVASNTILMPNDVVVLMARLSSLDKADELFKKME